MLFLGNIDAVWNRTKHWSPLSAFELHAQPSRLIHTIRWTRLLISYCCYTLHIFLRCKNKWTSKAIIWHHALSFWSYWFDKYDVQSEKKTGRWNKGSTFSLWLNSNRPKATKKLAEGSAITLLRGKSIFLTWAWPVVWNIHELDSLRTQDLLFLFGFLSPVTV